MYQQVWRRWQRSVSFGRRGCFAVRYRLHCGFGCLRDVDQRDYKGRGYILKWVLGTRKTAGADPAWLAWAEVVDALSVFVYEFWNSNLCKNVFDRLTMCNKIVEACCLKDDSLETQVAARWNLFETLT